MNEAQKAAIQRAMVIIDNMGAGATKVRSALATGEPAEQVLTRVKGLLDGIQDVGNAGIKWLEAAYNDKDYPST